MSAETRPSALEIASRVGLGLLAMVILWRVPEPHLVTVPTANTIGQIASTPLSRLLLEVVVGTVAGAAFALAARPIWGDWTYRWQLPTALALLPATILAVEILVLAGITPLPDEGLWRSTAVLMISGFSLRVTAVLLGVALAQGVVSDPVLDVEPGLGETGPTEPSDREEYPPRQ